MSYELQEARELVLKAGLELVSSGLIARTWGNISARISDTQFVITPSGRSYDSLIPEDIVIVNIKDCSYEGEIKPSGEKATHAEVYKQRPDVNFVVHTHQLYASSISIMDSDVTDITDHNTILGNSIPCAKYAISSSEALAKQVKNSLKKNPTAKALLLKAHGAVFMGADYEEAFLASRLTEEICKDRFDYYTSQFLNEADREVTVDFGSSYRKDGYIYLTVGDKSASWPMGYASLAKKSDVARELRSTAMLHDLMYEDPDINYVVHTKSPYTVIVSKLGKGYRPYIDDQCQIIGTDIKCLSIKTRHGKLRGIRKIKKAIDNHSAILLSTGGALCIGHAKDDIEAADMVLEKGNLAAILAHLIPVIKPVSKKDAAKMRVIYRDSYSKLKDYAVTASTLKEIDAP